MEAIVTLLFLPLMLLNSIGGVVAFVWLAILGKWSIIGYGIAFMIGMPILFSIAQLPGMGFTLAASWFADKKWRTLMILTVFLGSLWTSGLIVVWCIGVVVRHVNLAADTSLIPVLLWGYTVAIGPLAYMASKDGNNPFTAFQMLIAQVLVIGLEIAISVEASPAVSLGLILLALFTMPVLALIMGASELTSKTATSSLGAPE
jgi:hypothetical protein